MVGKSAHGRNGKIAYYEHGNSTKRQGCLVKQTYDCKPFRLQAKKLEPAVWEIISKYLKSPKAAGELLGAAKAVHWEESKTSGSTKLQQKMRELEGQMEKMEALKSEEQTRLGDLQRTEGSTDQVAPSGNPKGESIQGKVIRTLVRRIEILPEEFRLHLYVGRNYIEGYALPLHCSILGVSYNVGR